MLQDTLGDHEDAANQFHTAIHYFQTAATRIPHLLNFFQDYARYMKAWTHIEKARSAHIQGAYDDAQRQYTAAADCHQQTTRWQYLQSNYRAWAMLEEAEHLSRQDQPSVAQERFERAAQLFQESESKIEAALAKVESLEVQRMGQVLMAVAPLRAKYCCGRSLVEAAKILYQRGDPRLSAETYAKAGALFKQIQDCDEDPRLPAIILSCQAWQWMMQAEAYASADLYGRAADLFDQAQTHASNSITRYLALANSSFCRALDAGVQFEHSRDINHYAIAKEHLASAVNYYVKAGSAQAAQWVHAVQSLFDGYVYLGHAETHVDPRDKTRYYTLAYECLTSAAELYQRAGYLRKRDEIYSLRTLVQERQKFARSLVEIVETPLITSSTTLFAVPRSSQESAIGLTHFEHANLYVRLTAPTEARVDEEFEVRLDVVNVGKTPGLLLRVEQLDVPSLRVVKTASPYHWTRDHIDLKGRPLKPLQLESIILLMQAIDVGDHTLRPAIVYVDEEGAFHTRRPDAVPIRIQPPLEFQFKSEAAGKVFTFLVNAFIQDYMQRDLTINDAGWRTRVQISKGAHVSIRSLYGRRGQLGSAIRALTRRSLVETRFFSGERGRGGRILRARIRYAMETIKRYVNDRVAQDG